jgi:hypothetical protein
MGVYVFLSDIVVATAGVLRPGKSSLPPPSPRAQRAPVVETHPTPRNNL